MITSPAVEAFWCVPSMDSRFGGGVDRVLSPRLTACICHRPVRPRGPESGVRLTLQYRDDRH